MKEIKEEGVKVQPEVSVESVKMAKVETKEEVMENPDKKEEVAQEQVEETTAEQSPAPVTGMDRIKEAIARTTSLSYDISFLFVELSI